MSDKDLKPKITRCVLLKGLLWPVCESQDDEDRSRRVHVARLSVRWDGSGELIRGQTVYSVQNYRVKFPESHHSSLDAFQPIGPAVHL
jgi:hypothetical protein